MPQDKDVYIRLNQVGFLQDDIKSGGILSEQKIPSNEFNVINEITNVTVYSGEIHKSDNIYSKFQNCYNIDFTEVNDNGNFIIKVGDELSYPFIIGKEVYNQVVDSLLFFFKKPGSCSPSILLIRISSPSITSVLTAPQ